MRSKGRQDRSELTALGRIVLRRIYWWSERDGGKAVADELLGVAEATVSVGFRQLACLAGLESRSFARATVVLKQLSGIAVGEELLRQVVHAEGRKVQALSAQEQLPPGWSANQSPAVTPRGNVVSRVYVGADGVLVPTNTQQEKDKRRQTVLARRKALPRRRGHRRRRLGAVGKGSDQRYKQVYVTRIYDQSKARTLVGVSAQGPAGLRRVLRRDAARVLLRGAVERVGIVDGAVCLRTNLEFLPLEVILLDFYHLAEHVALAAKLTLTDDRRREQWMQQVLHTVRHQGYQPFYDELLAWRSGLRGSRRAAADRLIHYVVQRREMIRYDLAEQKNWDVGSGPMESQCGATTDRIKGRGRRWDLPNAVGVMALEALHQSNLWNTYWKTQYTGLN